MVQVSPSKKHMCTQFQRNGCSCKCNRCKISYKHVRWDSYKGRMQTQNYTKDCVCLIYMQKQTTMHNFMVKVVVVVVEVSYNWCWCYYLMWNIYNASSEAHNNDAWFHGLSSGCGIIEVLQLLPMLLLVVTHFQYQVWSTKRCLILLLEFQL